MLTIAKYRVYLLVIRLQALHDPGSPKLIVAFSTIESSVCDILLYTHVNAIQLVYYRQCLNVYIMVSTSGL